MVDDMSTNQKFSLPKKAYVVTVDMGYGHQRAVHPLTDIAAYTEHLATGDGPIITANNYAGIPKSDRRDWEGGRGIYETISRMKKLPVVGEYIFGVMDYLQRIEPFYPRRDLSSPTSQVKQIYWLIHRGWGKDLIERLNKVPLPLITSFFTIAFFAEEHGYQGDIFCICTDTDVSRAWAPLSPQQSRIKYLVPNRRVKERMMLYGIKPEQLFVTGFPLPKENIGPDNSILRQRLGCRISNLDPEFRYQKKFAGLLHSYLGPEYCDIQDMHPLTITFAVGGAGAQRDIGVSILESLHDHIDAGMINLNLVAGTRQDVFRYYESAVRELHLSKRHSGNVHILYAETKDDYFRMFNKTLLSTDILWSKPSELSFYAALGLPIIIAPPVGSQEYFNQDWLLSIGAGFKSEDPRYTKEWLFDWLKSGWLAEAAVNGFLNAPRHGAHHIEQVALHGKRSEIEDVHLL
jgi:hypothetical protein